MTSNLPQCTCGAKTLADHVRKVQRGKVEAHIYVGPLKGRGRIKK
jgi:hypothetical protein